MGCNIGSGIYAEAHVNLSQFEIRIRILLPRFFLQSMFGLQWTSKVIGNYELQHRQTRCAPYTMKVESKGNAFVNLSKHRYLSIRTDYTSR